MTAPMYKNGVSMEVTEDPAGRAELAKHGWTEKEPAKKQPNPKKVVADDNGK
jgi:hypothetical protein